jgi:hypothetical protein
MERFFNYDSDVSDLSQMDLQVMKDLDKSSDMSFEKENKGLAEEMFAKSPEESKRSDTVHSSSDSEEERNFNHTQDHNKYTKKLKIHKSSLLFVNNRNHVRHRKRPNPIPHEQKDFFDDKNNIVTIQDVFNDVSDNVHEQHNPDGSVKECPKNIQFINENHQRDLNNRYDY